MVGLDALSRDINNADAKVTTENGITREYEAWSRRRGNCSPRECDSVRDEWRDQGRMSCRLERAQHDVGSRNRSQDVGPG